MKSGNFALRWERFYDTFLWLRKIDIKNLCRKYLNGVFKNDLDILWYM